ncbi:hypothetical protein WA158_003598 [Blastocystis sp. Blastoise]
MPLTVKLGKGSGHDGSEIPIENLKEFINKDRDEKKNEVSLSDYLQGSTIQSQNQPNEKPNEEYIERIKKLKCKASQREYRRMVSDISKDIYPKVEMEKSESPLQDSGYMLGFAAAIMTVSIVMFYLYYRSHGIQFALSISVISGAVMLLLEAVLYIAQAIKYKDD